MNREYNDGISMIIVLWIITILTVLTTATVLMTTSDITATLNLVKRIETLQLAESGSDYMISMIPDLNLIKDNIICTDSIYFSGNKEAANRVYAGDDSTKSYVIAPIPMIHDDASGVNPYGPVSLGGMGSSWVFDFKTAGIIGKENPCAQKTIQVAAAWWMPVGETSMGHTMY
ncbi:pilus assembly PilX N-terminal domain-containing protein [candidate division WOR-3 bacterium]|nr:pilus assembly PilX N-terminal domain-containing protein [candidate division WOR-3 bacterium]MCK4528036.1 pilus assembly PilX N-terminal domain-containing protein [candidate division WOR-3 bacterium]